MNNKLTSVEDIIRSRLRELTGSSRFTLSRVGGGCINECYKAGTGTENFFLKLNSIKKFPSLFEKEKSGLEFLRRYHIFKIPSVIACGTSGDTQYLILEWIERGEMTPAFWENFGTGLAGMHKITNENFGFSEDNYIGSQVQWNKPDPNWVNFFTEQRIGPQLDLAGEAGDKLRPSFEKLYKKLPAIFVDDVPTALHGDLWAGNFIPAKNGQPVLIDPAVYYGHRSMDLGMTNLFGGFHRIFYEAYFHHFPLPPNYREQWEVANLYPLLIHLNLFGRSYLAPIENILNRYS